MPQEKDLSADNLGADWTVRSSESILPPTLVAVGSIRDLGPAKPPLPALYARNIRLLPAQPLSHVGLRQFWAQPPNGERAVLNWREVNNDPRFIAWLDNPNPLSGCTRQQLLNEATARGDAGRVIAFFRGFLQEAAAGHLGQAHQHQAQPDPVESLSTVARRSQRWRAGGARAKSAMSSGVGGSMKSLLAAARDAFSAACP